MEFKAGDVVVLVSHHGEYTVRDGWKIGDKAVVTQGDRLDYGEVWLYVQRPNKIPETFYKSCFRLYKNLKRPLILEI